MTKKTIRKASLLLAMLMTLSALFLFAGCAEDTSALPEGYVVSETDTQYVRLNITYVNKDGDQVTENIIVKLEPEVAPITVANFQKLVREDFYDGLIFHRVIKSFMIQGGNPKGNGAGGSKETIKGEFSSNGVENNLLHEAGVISMARSDDMNSASSQFFIVHKTSPHLDGNYAAFGKVVYGMATVNGIASVPTNRNDKPLNNVTINFADFVSPTAE